MIGVIMSIGLIALCVAVVIFTISLICIVHDEEDCADKAFAEWKRQQNFDDE